MSIDLTIYGLKGNSKVTETVVNGDLPVTTNGPFFVCPQCNLSSCTFLYIINNCYFYPLIQISQNGLLAIIIYLEQKKFSVSLIDYARKYICYSYSPYKTFVGFYRSMFFKMCLTLTIWKTCPNTAFLSRRFFNNWLRFEKYGLLAHNNHHYNKFWRRKSYDCHLFDSALYSLPFPQY